MKQSTDFTETQLERTLIHKGKVIDLVIDKVELPNKKHVTREVLLHSGGVVIVPVTSDGKFVLVEQFRYSIGQHLLEFPAGRLNKGEDPQEAALRELEEETGFIANKIEKLGFIYTAPGFCDEKLHIYLATELKAGKPNPDEDEFVNVVILSQDELAEKIKTQKIYDAKTLSGWAMLKNQK
jgi:ADP-ribose pyrophosphatase